MITSGYLVSDDPQLDGYRIERRVQDGGWAADLHVAPSRFRAHGAASPSVSSAARSRRPTRRRCASGCSATATARWTGAADVAVVNTCCVTNEALAKSRQAASRAARSHARVYVTGCGARLSEDAFAGLPANVIVVPGRIEEAVETVAGDVGAIGCVQADARLDRVRAFVKIQDGCSFSCAFCVIPLVRGATRVAERRGRPRRDPPPGRRRAIARSSSPASTSAASATAPPA